MSTPRNQVRLGFPKLEHYSWDEHLLELGKAFKLNIDMRGACHGIARTALFAFLHGDKAMQGFIESLAAADALKVEEIPEIEARIKKELEIRLRDVMKDLEDLQPELDRQLSDAKIQYPDIPEHELKKQIELQSGIPQRKQKIHEEIQAIPEIKRYMDAMALMQNIVVNQNITKYFDLTEDKTLTHQESGIRVSAAIFHKKEKDDPDANIIEYARTNQSYTKDELNKNLLDQINICNELQERIGVMMSNHGITEDHAINCGYDPRTGVWLLLDTGQEPIYEGTDIDQVKAYIWEGLEGKNNSLVIQKQIIMLDSAAEKLNSTQITRLVRPERSDPGQILLLHLWTAVANNDLDSLIALIHGGVNLNVIGKKDGFTPLGVAVYYGHKDIIKALLENGATMNIGVSPLELAVEYEKSEILKILIQHDTDYKLTSDLLFSAVESNDVETVQILLHAGVDIYEVGEKNGLTPIELALEYGHLDIVKIMKENDQKISSVNSPNPNTEEKHAVPLVDTLSSYHSYLHKNTTKAKENEDDSSDTDSDTDTTHNRIH